LSEHHAEVTVHAPVHQVYTLFTHFNDFPKFMTFIKEVTYIDDQHSHWVAEIAGRHEWDAVNEDWIEDRQVGWRSINGLENTGKVKFTAIGPEQTLVDVYLHYTPPAGILGELANKMGIDSSFDEKLQADLQHFAQMVEQAPPGALDPMQSHYLFHDSSAVATDTTTERQNASMAQDPMMSHEAMTQRQSTIGRETAQTQQADAERQSAEEQQAEQLRQAANQQEAALARQAEINRHNALQEQQAAQQQAAIEQEQQAQRDPIHSTIGGRNASVANTAFGDLDARTNRHPEYEQDPMLAREPSQLEDENKPSVKNTELESPWQRAIRGAETHTEEQATPPDNQTTKPQQ
jgi:hypothetical protein